MKLGLGAVQFGMNYGISNTEGQTTENELREILRVAKTRDLKVIDTAALYGSSEECLGRTLCSDHGFSIVTKTPKFQSCANPAETLQRTFMQSLLRLNSTSVYGLLFHDADDLLSNSGGVLWAKARELKAQGLVSKIGTSVYTSEQIDRLLERYQLDLVQLPFNILDQRLLHSGHLEQLKKAGTEIHCRSAFLQGLLLLDPERLSPHFDSVRSHLVTYTKTLCKLGLSPLQASLGYVLSRPEFETVICGINNHRQLLELCDIASNRELLGGIADLSWDDCFWNDPKILNPALWKL